MKRSKAVHLLYLGLAATALQGCERTPDPRAQEGAYFSMTECMSRFDQNLCTEAYAAAQTEHKENAPRFASQASCEAFAGPGMCESAPTASASAGAANAASGSAAGASGAGEAAPMQASSGGSVFVPALLGFMVGRAIGNSMGMGRGYYAGPPAGCQRYTPVGSTGACAPRSSGGSFGGGGGGYVGGAYSTTRAGRHAPFSGGGATATQPARVNPGSIADTRVSGSNPAAVRSGSVSRGGFGSTSSSRGYSSS